MRESMHARVHMCLRLLAIQGVHRDGDDEHPSASGIRGTGVRACGSRVPGLRRFGLPVGDTHHEAADCCG